MSSVAIELSRRGYVVMAVDPYTIGRSEIVNTPDVGSRAAMDYLMSMKFVDPHCIGAMGHSAGTGRAKWAVTTDPDCTVVREGVKAVFYLAAGNFNLEGVNMGVFIGKISARDIATAEPFTEPAPLSWGPGMTWETAPPASCTPEIPDILPPFC